MRFKIRFLSSFLLLIFSLFNVGCNRNTCQTWEDVKTASRYLKKGFYTLWGGSSDSRLIDEEEDFKGPKEEEFISLKESDLNSQSFEDVAIPQPKDLERKAGIQGMERFSIPPSSLANVFRTVYFETDDHVIRDKEDLITISRITQYLKKNPQACILVLGHCDERAAAAYNMALGTRRANHVRVLLVKQGVDPNRIYTISCGKEQPAALGHSPEDWRKNRRVEFKIYK